MNASKEIRKAPNVLLLLRAVIWGKSGNGKVFSQHSFGVVRARKGESESDYDAWSRKNFFGLSYKSTLSFRPKTKLGNAHNFQNTEGKKVSCAAQS